MLLKLKRVGEEGRQYWRASVRMEITAQKSTNALSLYRRWRCGARMRIVGKRITVQNVRKLLEKGKCYVLTLKFQPVYRRRFCESFNLIVSHRLRYAASFNHIAMVSDDILVRYREKEINLLLSEACRSRSSNMEYHSKYLTILK